LRHLHPFYGIKWPRLKKAREIICDLNDFNFLGGCYALLEILKIIDNHLAAIQGKDGRIILMRFPFDIINNEQLHNTAKPDQGEKKGWKTM